MAMTHTSAATRLGCGRDFDDVWAGIDAAPDAHERTCPHCQAVRASLTELAAATKDMATEDRANPLLRVSVQAMNEILAIARTEVRRGRTIALQQPARDTGGHRIGDPDLTISEHAISAVIRRTSDQIDGLEARRCAITPAPAPVSAGPPSDSPFYGAAGGRPGDPEPGVIAVDLTVSVSSGAAIPGLLAELRRRIIATVVTEVGVAVSAIDVRVEDIHDA